MKRIHSLFVLALVAAVLSACSGQVDAPPAPSCDPGSTDIMVLTIPDHVAEIDAQTAAEFGAGDCVKLADSRNPSKENAFCCWKIEAQP